jgi:cobalt-zinc-cadmium efflux system membrane fusion protein
MTRITRSFTTLAALAAAGALFAAGCATHGSAQEESGAPPLSVVEQAEAGSVASVEHPDQFPVVAAERYEARQALSVTGVVSPDVSRAVPVVSLATGRVVDLKVRLGDPVQKGQFLMRIESPDISAAFSDYRHAVADEILARAQLERSKALYDRGAIAKKDLEVAQDTEDKAVVDVETSTEHLRVLGADAKKPPTGTIDVMAPISGVITEQNITNAAGVQSLNSPNLFTISDMSQVWIVCDVYENDLPNVHVGDTADVRLNAYPDEVLTGRVSNILPTLDATIRTGKVRIEVANTGRLRLGMFATAVFHGQASTVRAAVPASAILHLHDRDWVYQPVGTQGFSRVEVVGGDSLAGGRQEVRSGLEPGQRVVANALALQNTVEQ